MTRIEICLVNNDKGEIKKLRALVKSLYMHVLHLPLNINEGQSQRKGNIFHSQRVSLPKYFN